MYYIIVINTAVNNRIIQPCKLQIFANCNTRTVQRIKINYLQNVSAFFFTVMLNFHIFVILAWDLVYFKTKRKYSFLKSVTFLKQPIWKCYVLRNLLYQNTCNIVGPRAPFRIAATR
jgi:hypothetical protein